MINHRKFLFLLSLPVLLVGCQSTEKGPDLQESGPEKSGGSKTQEPSVGTSKGAGVLPDRVEPPIGKETPEQNPTEVPTAQGAGKETKNPDPTKPEPKPTVTGNWKPAQQSAVDIAAKVDAGMKNLRDVTCDYSLTFKNPRETGSSNGISLIADPENFLIESLDADNVFGKIQILSVGKKSLEMGEKGWAPKLFRGLSARTKLAPSKTIRGQGSIVAFAGLTDGMDYWTALVKDLQKQGYEVKLVESNMDVKERSRPFYKITTSKEGMGINDLSITIDGLRFVPLTIRATETKADGKYVSEWRSRFLFEQKIDRTKLKLPN